MNTTIAIIEENCVTILDSSVEVMYAQNDLRSFFFSFSRTDHSWQQGSTVTDESRGPCGSHWWSQYWQHDSLRGSEQDQVSKLQPEPHSSEVCWHQLKSLFPRMSYETHDWGLCVSSLPVSFIWSVQCIDTRWTAKICGDFVASSMDFYRYHNGLYDIWICVAFSPLNTGVIPCSFRLLIKVQQWCFFSPMRTHTLLVNIWMTVPVTTIVSILIPWIESVIPRVRVFINGLAPLSWHWVTWVTPLHLIG